MECSTCSTVEIGANCSTIDLTHPLSDTVTIPWPGDQPFRLCLDCSVDPTYGFHYAAGSFTCAEHSGTHVDAPFHFAADGVTADKLPLCDLIAPGHTVDITDHCAADRDYCLNTTDIHTYEVQHGRITERSIVLVRTGWSKYYSAGPAEYLGLGKLPCGKAPKLGGDEAAMDKVKIDQPHPQSELQPEPTLSFPGISKEAAELLVERRVAAVGVDTASLDAGMSHSFPAHRVLLGAGVFGIESLSGGIDVLPATGYSLIVMPLKIEGGSGAPARVVALLPQDRC